MPALMVLINLCFEDSRALKSNPTVMVDETWETRKFVKAEGVSGAPSHNGIFPSSDTLVGTVVFQCDLLPMTPRVFELHRFHLGSRESLIWKPWRPQLGGCTRIPAWQ